MLIFDDRWRGKHGIGRYAAALSVGIDYDRALRANRVSPASAYDPFWLAMQLGRSRATHFLTPAYNASFPSMATQFLFLHDLIHLDVPDESSAAKRFYYDRLVKPTIRRAQCVFTVSKFSQNRICAWAGLEPKQVHIIPPGIEMQLDGPTRDDSIQPRDAKSDGKLAPYVLYVGNAKPHKRLAYLLAALPWIDADLRLKIVGVGSSQIARYDIHENHRGRIDVMHNVSDAELQDLYAGAQCLAFPSEYEGFGLPPLEALFAQTPVAYSCEAVGENVDDEIAVKCPMDRDAREFAECINMAARTTWTSSMTTKVDTLRANYNWATSLSKLDAVLRDRDVY